MNQDESEDSGGPFRIGDLMPTALAAIKARLPKHVRDQIDAEDARSDVGDTPTREPGEDMPRGRVGAAMVKP